MSTAIDVASERARVAEVARSWIGTPFHHAARIKGVGVDCMQLLAAVYEEAGVQSTPTFEDYPPDWFLHDERERYVLGLAGYTVRLAAGEPYEVGDIATFRYGRAVSHAGIIVDVALATEPFMVHALRGIGVTLDQLTPTDAMTSRLACVVRPRRWMP